MPHSIPEEPEMVAGDEVRAEQDAVADAQPPAPAAEEDVDMADIAPEPTPAADASKDETALEFSSKEENQKQEVKLEDLFADVESDDEFPSSRPADGTPASSSPGEMTPTSR
jgi:DNA primase small subunit